MAKIAGRNPVTEAIRAGRPIDRILVQEGAGGAADRVKKLAKENGIPVEIVPKRDIDKLAAGENHQGIVAFASSHDYASVDDILAAADKKGEAPFIAHGVIIPKRNACGLTETVAKTSAGAVEYVPCARVTNIARTLEDLKERGIWVYACDMDGKTYYKQDMTGPCAIVIGAEGKGISRLVKEKCDFTVSMPLMGKIQSLNASNAACVLMYEIRRQRDEK